MQKLAAKMLAVMAAVGHIPKRGKNLSQNYQYVTEADMADGVRDAMVKNGVALFVTTLERSVAVDAVKTKFGAQNLTTVKMQFTFMDVESGEKFESIFYGDGMDGGDKGLYKAMTGADKYALMKEFLVPTGDDPELDAPEKSTTPTGDAPPRPQPSKKNPDPKAAVWDICKKAADGDEQTAKDIFREAVGKDIETADGALDIKALRTAYSKIEAQLKKKEKGDAK